MRMLTIFLSALLFWLLVQLAWGKNGISDYLEVKAKVEEELKGNQAANARNQKMYAEIADLKAGLEAIEERARHELGLIKPKETFYRLVNE